MKFGDDNERVGSIQAMLNALMTSKYNAGKIDGKFGEKTLKAINNFKNDNGLYNIGIWNGVVDSKTRSELVTASTQMFEDGLGCLVMRRRILIQLIVHQWEIRAS